MNQINFRRCDIFWPNKTFFVGEVFGNCAHHARNTNAITTHNYGFLLTVFICKIDIERVRIFAFEMESVSNFGRSLLNQIFSFQAEFFEIFWSHNFFVDCDFLVKINKNLVFTNWAQSLKFIRKSISKNSTISVSSKSFFAQTKPFINSMISFDGAFINLLVLFLISSKSVHIFHQKFTPTHQTRFCAKFVAEFILNLINRNRQILVRIDILANHINNRLFVRKTNAELSSVGEFSFEPVVDFFVAPTISFFPNVARLKRCHHHLLTSCGVHFFSNDVFNFFENF